MKTTERLRTRATVELRIPLREYSLVVVMTLASVLLAAGPMLRFFLPRPTTAFTYIALYLLASMNALVFVVVMLLLAILSLGGLVHDASPFSAVGLALILVGSPFQWLLIERLLRERFGAPKEP